MKKLATALFFAAVFCLTTVSALAQNTSKLRVGSYSATVTQNTVVSGVITYMEVRIKIKIDSIDDDGNVKGEFMKSGFGKGSVTGKVIKDPDFDEYNLQLKGSLVSKFGDTWEVSIAATVGDKQLTRGSYGMRAGGIAQGGHFETAKLEE